MDAENEHNPLLAMTGLPPFSRIRPGHVAPAVDALLHEGRTLVADLLARDEPPTWAGLVAPIAHFQHRLGRVWSPVRHLHSVADSPELREVYDACLGRLTAFYTELGQNRYLYQAYRAIAEGPENAALDPAQRKILQDALREFRLAGVDLPAAEQSRFKAIREELAGLSSRFSQNVLDATEAWTLAVDDPERLRGLPPSALDLLARNAAARGREGWLLTLDVPSYLPVLTYAEDRDLRREAYTAYTTRASDQGPHAGRFDNGPVMEDILALRHELASLLGYASYAEYSLERKMARSVDQVLGFLHDLAERTRPVAEGELREVSDFARERDGLASLEAWDIPYYSERLRRERFAFSQEDLRPYFPLPRVLEGLFLVAGRLYGLEVTTEGAVDAWHPDVRFFTIRERDGAVRGHFYLDLYARPGKRAGAWMDECVVRLHENGVHHDPVAYLVANFTPPGEDQPALLTHQEVLTLFHEFGHGLHHMLTRVDYPDAAGINGVAWDAVELPSQLMENWCWEREALDLFARHVDHGGPIPPDLLGRMQAARSFQSGMQMLRQLEFALFDMRLHAEYDPRRGARVQELLEEVRARVAVVHPPAFNRFAHGFSHIFAGGYAAGYYSYKWAEVLSADAFSAFEEAGVFSEETGRRFREAILEQGGSREAMELYREFRGREPTIDALLRHSGIAA